MRWTIRNRLLFGFGTLIVLTIFIFSVTFFTVNSSSKISNEITGNYSPSVITLERLNILVVRSKMLIYNWFYVQNTDDIDKKKLKSLIKYEFPIVRKDVEALTDKWEPDEQEQINIVFRKLDSLFIAHNEVMNLLGTFDSYKDAMSVFLSRDLIDSRVSGLTGDVLDILKDLIQRHQDKTNKSSKNMISSFTRLQLIVIYSGILLVVGGLFVALLTTNSIVKPVSKLKKMLVSMGRGVLPIERLNERKDEIGDMTQALNELLDGLTRTVNFSSQVGMGNFGVQHEPLSDDDTLSYTLLKMRDELKESERILEEKVRMRTEEVVEKNIELQVLYNQVTDSIKYAKRIQEAILPPDEIVKGWLPESFILYRPKDIVSGDFYWVEEIDGNIYFAAVDCTGHGVPGAFMSIVGHNLLRQIVDKGKHLSPAKILDNLSAGITNTLRQTSEEHGAKDGMDIALCMLEKKTMKLHYAGAYNPLFVIRNGELKKTDPDKFPVGIFYGREVQRFTEHEIQLEQGDRIYIFSDGYIDQFGGSKGKKLMSKRFREILLDVQDKQMEEQKDILIRRLEDWMGEYEQVDDIIVIGVEV